MKLWAAILGVGVWLLATSCERKPPGAVPVAPRAPQPPAPATVNTQVFQVKGIVVEVTPAEKSVRIRHEEIPGYMERMTMVFEVRDTNELAGLEAGNTVAFRMLVTEKDGWIDQIKKLPAPLTTLPANAPIRLVRDVEPLNPGDALPEYHFTNHLGQPVSLSQFRGQALAVTFIFTRCPFPKFCPLVSSNFEKVQDLLARNSAAPTNWHLLTISFDPDYDTPERLAAYAAKHHADPARWEFLTGELLDVTALAEQAGLQFWLDEGGGINHNLRTMVVDARGRVQSILRENKWTPEELVGEILKAAK